MSNPFYTIYLWIKDNTWVAVILLSIPVLLLLFNKDKLVLESSISKVLPSSQKEDTGDFFESNLSQRIIARIYSRDSTDPIETMQAVAICDSLVTILQEQSNGAYEILARSQPSNIARIYDHVLDYLPVYLTNDHWDEILKSDPSTGFEDRLKKGHAVASSPLGLVFAKKFYQDPFGFSNHIFNDLKSLQMDDDLKMKDGYFYSRDEESLLFFIIPAHESFHAGIVEKLDKIAADFAEQSRVRIDFFGAPIVAQANEDRILKDTFWTVLAALIGLFILLFSFFRRLSFFVILIVPFIAGIIYALSFISVFHPTISIIAIGLGSILTGIAIDYGIHFLTQINEGLSKESVLRKISIPVLLSGTTTAAAFFCLMYLNSAALNDMGLIAGLGTLFSAVLSLILLPHLIKSKGQKGADSRIQQWANYDFHKSRLFKYSILTLAFLGLFTAFKVEFESDLNRLGYMGDDLRRIESSMREVTSAAERNIIIKSAAPTLSLASEQLWPVLDNLNVLKTDEVIRSFSHVANLLPSENVQRKRIAKWKSYWTEDRIMEIRAIIDNNFNIGFEKFSHFLSNISNPQTIPYEELKALAKNPLLETFYEHKKDDHSLLAIVNLEHEKKDAFYEKLNLTPGITVLDRERLFHQFIEILKDDYETLVWMSFLVVFIILVLAYGRIELAFIAILPIVFSWLITLGLMYVLGLKFNMINIILTSFIFGLGVDYSIFMLAGLREKYRNGSEGLPVHKSSILLSSLTTIVGVGVLSFAIHPAMRSIGLISVIGVISVVLSVFTLEPLLFEWLTYKNGKRRLYPLTLMNLGKTIWIYSVLGVGSVFMSILALIFLCYFSFH